MSQIFNCGCSQYLLTMIKYDFDTIIDRRGTGAMKYDALDTLYGNSTLNPLWIADMEFAACPEIVKALIDRFSHPVYGYASTPESYWESICSWLELRHGYRPARESLAFVPGVVRGIAYAMNFFSRPGSRVVIQEPVYHPFRAVAEGNDRLVINNPLLPTSNGGYKMDLEGLEHIFATERPKILILCNPHNPAGIQWDTETLRTVARLAKKYEVIVLSDEIHGDLMLWGGKHIPFASVSQDAADVSVTFGAPSKTFNIPGLVSSWMIVPNKKLREPFFRWMEANEFSSPTFTATVGTEAAYRHGEEWLNQLLTYIEENIIAVEHFFAENCPKIKPLRPQASFLVWLDCRELGLNQPDLCKWFTDHGLALNDGSMFGAAGSGFMRLNVAMPRAALLKALSSLKQ